MLERNILTLVLLLFAAVVSNAQSGIWSGTSQDAAPSEIVEAPSVDAEGSGLADWAVRWDQRESANLAPLPHEMELETEMDIQPGRQAKDRSSLFFLLMGLALMLGVLRMYFSRELGNMLTSLGNIKLAQQAYRDREFGRGPAFLFLFVLFLGSLGLFLFLVADRQGVILDQGPLGIFWPVALVLLFFLLRFMARWLAGWLFRLEDEFGFFNYNITLLNGLAGMLLVPLLFIIGLGTETVSLVGTYAGLVLLAGLVLWRMVRGLQIGSGVRGLDNIHFILYICTLEIAPILIVYKLISDWTTVS